jgi:hypothetical protein
MVEIYCPICDVNENKFEHHPGAGYCFNCGSRLKEKVKTVAPIEKIPITELTALILKTINTIAETEKKEAKEREESKMKRLSEEHSYVRHTINADGINLMKTVRDEQAEIVIYEDSPKGGETILSYIVDLEALPELWDDLTDIMGLGAHPNIIRKYFKQFSVRDKPYKQHVTVIYEGGDLYVK